jgi:septal ring factor EnvC (AmiA/AmiB activator)
VPFGNVRHPRFQTEIPHPGIDLAAEPGDEVRVVFDGRVVFSSWFRGYGQLIVVDHADGYLSIYGHLGERLVEVGDEVYGGDVIARSGEGGTLDRPSLYFEIRRDGEPEDPLPWLRPGFGERYDRTRPGG